MPSTSGSSAISDCRRAVSYLLVRPHPGAQCRGVDDVQPGSRMDDPIIRVRGGGEADVLRPGDYRALLDILPDLYRLQDLGTLAPVMLRHLDRLIPSVMSTYNEIDMVTGKTILVTHPPERHDDMMGALAPGVPALAEHPLFNHFQRADDHEIVAISDLVSREEWLKNPFYLHAQSPLGLEETLLVPLMLSTRQLSCICFNRPDRSFTERERLLAGLLRPHLMTAYKNARAFTEARALAMMSRAALDRADAGIVLVDATKQVVHINSRAVALLDAYYSPEPSRPELPDEIIRWLRRPRCRRRAEGPSAASRAARRPGARVSRRDAFGTDQDASSCCASTASAPSGSSSSRSDFRGARRRCSTWVGEGKSNADTAAILGISRRTVDKHHLEHVHHARESRKPHGCTARSLRARRHAAGGGQLPR